MRLFITTALLSSLCFALFAGPSQAADNDPEAVVQAYMTAWKADGLPSTASFFDPKGVSEVAEQMKPLLEMDDANGANPLRNALRGPEFTSKDVAGLDSSEVFSIVLQMTEGSMQRQGGASLDSFKVLGAVPETDELVHVVARASMKYRDVDLNQVNLISTQKRNGKWTIAMRSDLKQMITGMRQQLVAAMAQQAKKKVAP